MMKKVSRSTTPELYIGLDVHKSSISVAYAGADDSAPIFYGRLGGTNLCAQRGLSALCKKLGVEKGDLRLCYDCHPSTGGALPAKPALAG